MLQLLYPCSQYSADKCLLCGGKFRDHLTLRWSKHFYTPFDRHLDRVHHDGVVNAVVNDDNHVKTKHNRASTSPPPTQSTSADFCYHFRYVLDITHLLQGIQNRRDRSRILQRAISQRYQQATDIFDLTSMEQRRVQSTSPKLPLVTYVVPRPDVNPDVLKVTTPTRIVIWLFAREVCLNAIDKLVNLEAMDRERSNR
jgi:hypothetical protein